MTGIVQLLPLIGVTLCLTSALLLRRGWRSEGRARPRWAFAGWSVLGLAVWPYQRSMGAVVGGTAWLLAFGLCGMVVTFHGMERRSTRARSRQPGPGKGIDPVRQSSVRWRGWARGSAALLLTLLSANAICAAVAGVAPGAAAMRFSIAMLVLPLVWAGLVIWTLSDRVLRRPILGMTGAFAASGATITWSVLA